MSKTKVSNVSAEQAYKLINENKNLIILDVRTNEEYQSGHIAGAKLIPVQVLAARLNELKEYQAKPMLVYCASGGRSPKAVNFLLANGFTEIYHLDRGISSWRYELTRKMIDCDKQTITLSTNAVLSQ